MGETSIPVQELWLKMGRGLMHERGRNSTVIMLDPILRESNERSVARQTKSRCVQICAKADRP